MADISLNLHENNQRLDPLEYSDGRTQTDVVEEILDALRATTGLSEGGCGFREVGDRHKDGFGDGWRGGQRPDEGALGPVLR